MFGSQDWVRDAQIWPGGDSCITEPSAFVCLLTTCHIVECCVWEMFSLMVSKSQNIYFYKCVYSEIRGVILWVDRDSIQNQFLYIQNDLFFLFDNAKKRFDSVKF